MTIANIVVLPYEKISLLLDGRQMNRWWFVLLRQMTFVTYMYYLFRKNTVAYHPVSKYKVLLSDQSLKTVTYHPVILTERLDKYPSVRTYGRTLLWIRNITVNLTFKCQYTKHQSIGQFSGEDIYCQQIMFIIQVSNKYRFWGQKTTKMNLSLRLNVKILAVMRWLSKENDKRSVYLCGVRYTWICKSEMIAMS